MGDSPTSTPKWLSSLLEKDFFHCCSTHDQLKWNEQNIFCIDCCLNFCRYCVANHPSHNFLHVRRHHGHALIKIEEMEQLISCSFVQMYSLNRARVVYLHKREQPQSTSCRFTSLCFCGHALPKKLKYCSITCKVETVMKNEGTIGSCLHNRNLTLLPLNRSDLEEDDPKEDQQLSLDPILDDPTTSNSNERIECSGKRNGEGTSSPRNLRGMRRRKGVPQRSPFY